MKLLSLLFLFSLTTWANLETPRDTFKTFLKSMVKVKEGDSVQESLNRAITTFDLSRIDPAAQKEAGIRLSEGLINVFDRLEKINYEDIPLKAPGGYWIYDKRSYSQGAEDQQIEISLRQIDGQWKFGKETIESIPLYKKILSDKEVVEGVQKLRTWRDMLRGKLPAWSQKGLLGIEIWQYIGLALMLLAGYILEKLLSFGIQSLLNKNIPIFERAPEGTLNKAAVPFGQIVLLYIVYANLYWLDLEPTQLAFIKRAIFVITAIEAVWLGHRIVQIVAYYLRERAANTVSKFDDIMIPLISKTSFVLVYLFGAVLVLSALTVDVTGLLAGLGIGGLAFAFAAKDTLANFFGSIMLVLDRPFDIGDVITTGDIEGVVVEVGFRSTRIRTFYDSIITVSNGDLVNRPIDNKGKRRYRRLSTTLGLEYDTPPEKIEAFCEGVRQLILAQKFTRKDNFNVYFVGYGASSLDVQLMVFWETDDYAREQAEKHRLNIDILRLAADLEVNFAFPTTTVHLFNEAEKPAHKALEKYLDEGIGRAKELQNRPLSLKNPRSNANDEEQFGKNDIGV